MQAGVKSKIYLSSFSIEKKKFNGVCYEKDRFVFGIGLFDRIIRRVFRL